MKKLLKIMLSVIFLMTFCCAANAQQGKKRVSREQLALTQARHIADELALDDATSQRFINTYCEYQKEVWALDKPTRKKGQQMSDKETEQLLKARFAHSQKILDLRQKYYGIYSEFMTQKQIQNVYKQERQMMNRLAKRKNVRKQK